MHIFHNSSLKLLCGIALSLGLHVSTANAGIAPSYYDGVNTSSASLLRSTLNATLSSGEIQLGYDNTWIPLRDVDQATTSADHVRLIYGGTARLKDSGTDADGSPVTGGWNREHLFPQSFFNQDEPMRSDIHALYPCDSDVNTRRSNSPYDVVAAPTYQDELGNRATSSVFEPADVDKGRAARAILYMDVRYEGLNGEPNLTIINSYPVGTGAGQMAYLNTLLTWHRTYPPDAAERARNFKAYRYQQNANPFVDHPEWVDDIYGGPLWAPEDGNTVTIAGSGPASGNIPAGSADAPVLLIPAQTTGQEVHLAGITLLQNGSIADPQLTSVNLWYDVDNDGHVSHADSQLAAGTFTSGSANLALSHPFYLAPGFNQLLVSVDVPVWATPGSTVQISIPESGVILSSTGGQDIITPFGQVAGNVHTVAASNDALAGLVISEVFEGSQGNLKYIEFYNGTSQSIDLGTAELSLRRFTNGNLTPTNLSLPAGTIAVGDVYVLANNSSDFTSAFGFAPDGVDSNISHNGNDVYDLYRSSTGLLIDAFAGDRIGSSTDFAVDRVAHRKLEVLPNSGSWGTPVMSSPPDGSVSPSGFWGIRAVSPGNGNAQQVGTPGLPGEPVTSVEFWPQYEQ